MSAIEKDIISERRPGEPYDARFTEFAYHTKFNRSVAVLSSVTFLFHAIFFYCWESNFQALIFLLLFLDTVSAIFLSRWLKAVDKLVRMKIIATAIAFLFWAISLFVGVLSDDIYIFLPWIFVYPLAIIFMFGRRIGIYSTILFSLLIAAAVVMADLPDWNQSNESLLKFNSIFALFVLLGVASFSERARVRVQYDLISAQNSYKTAEQRQREINLELEHEIRLRKQSEHALAQSEIRYRAFFEESAVSIWQEDWSILKQYIDTHADDIKGDLHSFFKKSQEKPNFLEKMIRITAVNHATLDLYEADSQDILLKNMTRILPEPYLDYILDKLGALLHFGKYHAEIKSQTINGRPLHLLVSSSVPVGFEASWQRIYTTVFDNTERVLMAAEKRRVRKQLQSARQIQAVATLAGGIAHKFNNALMVIVLNLDLLEMRLQGDRSLSKILSPLRESAEKIGQLTEQLLAYAQGGKYQPKKFSVNELIRGLLAEEKMAPEASVQLITDFEPDICRVKGDIVQIKMVMQAVIFNAFESMANAGNGNVMIETRSRLIGNVKLEENIDLPPGKYAVISISDDGVGMDHETIQRIFEPFFTTKVIGRGLGMAAAYGIVKNHSGIIAVQSQPGRGSNVKIYLPEYKP